MGRVEKMASFDNQILKEFKADKKLEDGIHAFLAHFCGHCHRLYPDLVKVEEYVKKHGGPRIVMYDGTKLDGVQHRALAEKDMAVRGFPTMYLVKDGAAIEQIQVRDAQGLIEKLQSIATKPRKLERKKLKKQETEAREALKEQIMIALLNHPRLAEILTIIFEES